MHSNEGSAHYGQAHPESTSCKPENHEPARYFKMTAEEAFEETLADEGHIYGRGQPPEGGVRGGESPELTGVSHRAKQFVPFAALSGFYEMIDAVEESGRNGEL